MRPIQEVGSGKRERVVFGIFVGALLWGYRALLVLGAIELVVDVPSWGAKNGSGSDPLLIGMLSIGYLVVASAASWGADELLFDS